MAVYENPMNYPEDILSENIRFIKPSPERLQLIPTFDDKIMKAVRMNEPTNYPAKAKLLVEEYLRRGVIDNSRNYDEAEFYIVWFCKTLQNWKAIVETTFDDGLYFEVTHNGDKGETYIDVYEKKKNFVIKDDEAA